jgi:hypothetical protein
MIRMLPRLIPLAANNEAFADITPAIDGVTFHRARYNSPTPSAILPMTEHWRRE